MTPKPCTMPEETGWLVEIKQPLTNGVPTYFSFIRGDETGNYYSSHTADSVEALRFARKRDAEEFIKYEGLSKNHHAVEHMWTDHRADLVERKGE